MASGGGNRSWAGGKKLASGVGAIGSFVPEVTRKAFERHGFPAGRLAADWATIVGEPLARHSRPERIKWPRPVEDENGEWSEPAGATLVLRVDGARALEVQYRAAQIMEKINGFLGYRAITEIRLVQAPIVCRLIPPVDRQAPIRLRVATSDVMTTGSPLINALDRLGRSVAASGTAGRP
jgi:hypothetical protein